MPPVKKRCAGNLLAGLLLLAVFMSCAGAPATPPQPIEPATATPLFVPEQDRSQGFFSFSDSSILRDMEIGSPASIRRAAAKVRNPSTQPEKVLVAVASSLMSIVWPSEQNTIAVPSDIEPNAYTAAIESARMGIYDVNTGNTDFFTIVLPSLVLLTSQTQSDYYSQSQAALTTGLQMRPDSVLVRYLLGCLSQRMGDLDAALDMFGRAVDLDENCLETGYALAEVNFLLYRYEEAQHVAEGLLAKYPGNLKVLKLLAQIASATGNYTVAEGYINQVLQREPDNAQFILLRVEVLLDRGDYVKAVSLLDAYSRVDKISKDYLLLRSRLQYEWNKNAAAAAATAEQALELYPDDDAVVLAAAHLATITGNRVQGKTAGELAQEILAQDPDNPDAIFIRAEDAVVRKDWNTAYSSTSRLMEFGALNLARRLLHVEACLGVGRVGEAQREIQPLYEQYMDSDEVKELYIRTLAAAGSRGEVRSLIASLLPSASSQLKSFLYYQRSLLATSDADKLADLRQSLTANPRNSEALFQLYRYYFDRQDYRKAQYYLKQVVALSPNDEEMLRLNSELDALVR